MNTCSTCRWWDEESICDDHRVGYCELAMFRNDKYAHPESKAKAEDGSGYIARLITKPDFGCNQWEGKDE